MDNERVLRIKIDCKAFHLENFSNLASDHIPVVKDSLAISIHSFEIQLTHEEAECRLPNLIFGVAHRGDIFEAHVNISYIHSEIVEDLDFELVAPALLLLRGDVGDNSVRDFHQ